MRVKPRQLVKEYGISTTYFEYNDRTMVNSDEVQVSPYYFLLPTYSNCVLLENTA